MSDQVGNQNGGFLMTRSILRFERKKALEQRNASSVANSGDPDQTAPQEAFCSVSPLFAQTNLCLYFRSLWLYGQLL